jgi:hypothetical protein
MLIPFGVLSAAGAGVVGGDYELISTTVLGTATSSVTFSSLGDYSSTYKHLQIRMTGRTSRVAQFDYINLRLNGDTGNNYTAHYVYGDGSSVQSGFEGASISRAFVGTFAGNSATASIFGASVFDILDAYSTTKNKTTRALHGVRTGSFQEVFLSSGLYMSTAATNSVTILPTVGPNFLTGSRFSLYGIKG